MRRLGAMFLVIASPMAAPAVDAQTASWQVLTSAEVQLDSPIQLRSMRMATSSSPILGTIAWCC